MFLVEVDLHTEYYIVHMYAQWPSISAHAQPSLDSAGISQDWWCHHRHHLAYGHIIYHWKNNM